MKDRWNQAHYARDILLAPESSNISPELKKLCNDFFIEFLKPDPDELSPKNDDTAQKSPDQIVHSLPATPTPK